MRTQTEDTGIRRAIVVSVAFAALLLLGAGLLSFRSRRPFLARYGSAVRGLVSPTRLAESAAALGKSPHPAGSPANAAVADEIARRLTAAGLAPWNDIHEVDLRDSSSPGARGKAARVSVRSVLATIPGRDPAASAIVVGTHLDASARAVDERVPGAAVVLEVATVLAALAKDGWTPSRPVIFAFYDGGEGGMLGATRWIGSRVAGSPLPALAFLDPDTAPSAPGVSFASTVASTPGLRGLLGEMLAPGGDAPTAKPAANEPGAVDLPVFSIDAVPFLGLGATPVAEFRFASTDAEPARAAALCRHIVLAAGMLATPRLFPLRFEEISDFTNRQLRGLQGRHPAAIGWLAGASRSLDSQILAFESAARLWAARTRDVQGPGPNAGRIDRNLAAALGAFTAPGEAFGRGCRLWGPAVETGHAAAPLPALEDALARGDRAAATREIDHLAAAFSQAREQLAIANLLAEGDRPARRSSSGARRP